MKNLEQEENLINRIERHYFSLSKSEKIVAVYVKENFHEAQSFTINDYSEKLKVGKTTVIRFTKKIGFNGFADFKQSLFRYIGKHLQGEKNSFEIVDHFQQRLEKLISTNVNAIEETGKLMNEKDIMKVVHWMVSSSRVYLMGVGSSGITALDTKHKLLHIGINADAVTDVQLLNRIKYIVESNDIVIGLSISGESENVINALRTAKERGAKVIAVTYTAGSEITEFADIVLISAARDWDERAAAFAAKIGQLQVMDILFNEVCNLKQIQEEKGE